MPQSPTANLPNLVEGTSPRAHFKREKKERHSDWLTDYAKEKKLGLKGNSKMKEAMSGFPKSSGFSKVDSKKSKKKKDVQLKLKV